MASVATIAFPVASYSIQLTPVGVATPDFVTMNVTGTAVLNVGRTSQMTAIVVLTDGTKRDVTTGAKWSSAATSVATVSASGLVTAYAPGSSLISATFQSVTGSLTATISKLSVVTESARAVLFGPRPRTAGIAKDEV